MSQPTGESGSSDFELNLHSRREALADMIGRVIGNTNERLKNPKQPLMETERLSAALMYGEVVRRFPGPKNNGLPEGFARCEEPVSEIILQEFHIHAINRYLETGTSFMGPTELAGLRASGLHQLYPQEFMRYISPQVEGYHWFRGFQVVANETDRVLLLSPMMQPWYIGGSPFPVMYTSGNPEPQLLQDIARDFGLQHSGQSAV